MWPWSAQATWAPASLRKALRKNLTSKWLTVNSSGLSAANPSLPTSSRKPWNVVFSRPHKLKPFKDASPVSWASRTPQRTPTWSSKPCLRTLMSKPPCSTLLTTPVAKAPSSLRTRPRCPSMRWPKPPVEPTVLSVCISSTIPPRIVWLRSSPLKPQARKPSTRSFSTARCSVRWSSCAQTDPDLS